jgi:hypothetical protein
VAITSSVRVGALAIASALAVLLSLILSTPASAERPGWYSMPSINLTAPTAVVGGTLLASDGGLKCDPGCVPAGDQPERAGVFIEWVSCTGQSGGGGARPTGGMPDDPRPCPGGVSRGEPSKTATAYVIRPEDAGRYIQIHVIATNLDCAAINVSTGTQECNYSSAHGYSGTVGPIGGSGAPAPNPTPPPAPTVTPPNMTAYPTTSGAAKEGETLTAANGSWTSSPTKYGYQWKRCAPEYEPCEAIAGATAQTYTLTPDDVGKRVQVLVTATNAKGSNSAASLPGDIVATAAVKPESTAAPTISGEIEDRQTLTASPGTWGGTAPIAYAYQWLRCSTRVGGCAAIEGATASTYVVTRDDLAARLLVSVTATNRGGTTTMTSALTTHVVPARPRPGADRLNVTDVVASGSLRVAEATPWWGRVKPRGRVAVTVRVKDARGFLIEGAQVTVTGRRGQVVRGATVTTNANGVAVLRLRAGAKLPKRTLVLTVTVTKPGETTGAKKSVAIKVAAPKVVKKAKTKK